MPHDQQTYRRAASAALTGLGVQFALALAMALLGLWAKSPALHAATWHLFGGLPIWIVLWLLYNQHRIERVEALEAEQLVRKDQQAAAIFQEHADDLDLARRRLDRLYKWGLNIVSFVVAAYLLVAGLVLLYQAYGLHTADKLTAQAIGADVNPMVLMFGAASVAFVAFIVARYVSGMTGVKEWHLLRGGASYLMGSFVIALLIVAAALMIVAFGNKNVVASLAIIIPALMSLVGVEILLTFMLSVYRPRKPGEVPRPAFDSRVLGLLTAPESLGKIINDTINYQFGFEVSRSWFYQLLGKAVTPLIAFGLLILLTFSSVVVVQPHQQAVVTRFGSIVGEPMGPGIHLKWPWPIGDARMYAVERVHQIYVGSVKVKRDANTAILWTNQHADGKEEYLVTAPTPISRRVVGSDARTEDGGSAGVGLIPAEIVVQYRIRSKSLLDFVQAADDPVKLLEAIADRWVTTYFASHDVDMLLARGRIEAGSKLKEQIQAEVDAHKLGLDIIFVGMTSVHPPTESEVADTFHEVINALQEKESKIQEAHSEAIKTLAQAAGSLDHARAIDATIKQLEDAKQQLDNIQFAENPDAAKVAQLREQIDAHNAKVVAQLATAKGEIARLRDSAMAYRWERAITEQAKADRFAAELESYRMSPEYYRKRQYLNTLADQLAAKRKVIVTTDSAEPSTYRFDFKDAQSAMDFLIDAKQR